MVESASPEETPEFPEGLLSEKLSAGAETLPSPTHPERNEDAILSSPEEGLFGVFDGVGGNVAGEVASRVAAAVVKKELGGLSSSGNWEKSVDEALCRASNAVTEAAAKDPRFLGMETTASVVKILPDPNPEGGFDAVIGNVGDSRVYLFREGRLQPLTIDDGFPRVAAKGDRGRALEIQTRIDNATSLAELRASLGEFGEDFGDLAYAQRNKITQALGKGGANPRVDRVSLREGDLLVLTSDGLHDNLTDREFERSLGAMTRSRSISSKELAQTLVAQAQTRSKEKGFRSKRDDISVLVVSVGKPEAPSPVREQAPREESLRGRSTEVVYRGPITLELGGRGGTTLEIISPSLALERYGAKVRADFLLVDPRRFDPQKDVGYKGLRRGEPFELGRDKPGRFTLPDTVSRRHLRVELLPSNRFRIEDLNSSNGTTVKCQK